MPSFLLMEEHESQDILLDATRSNACSIAARLAVRYMLQKQQQTPGDGQIAVRLADDLNVGDIDTLLSAVRMLYPPERIIVISTGTPVYRLRSFEPSNKSQLLAGLKMLHPAMHALSSSAPGAVKLDAPVVGLALLHCDGDPDEPTVFDDNTNAGIHLIVDWARLTKNEIKHVIKGGNFELELEEKDEDEDEEKDKQVGKYNFTERFNVNDFGRLGTFGGWSSIQNCFECECVEFYTAECDLKAQMIDAIEDLVQIHDQQALILMTVRLVDRCTQSSAAGLAATGRNHVLRNNVAMLLADKVVWAASEDVLRRYW